MNLIFLISCHSCIFNLNVYILLSQKQTSSINMYLQVFTILTNMMLLVQATPSRSTLTLELTSLPLNYYFTRIEVIPAGMRSSVECFSTLFARHSSNVQACHFQLGTCYSFNLPKCVNDTSGMRKTSGGRTQLYMRKGEGQEIPPTQRVLLGQLSEPATNLAIGRSPKKDSYIFFPLLLYLWR